MCNRCYKPDNLCSCNCSTCQDDCPLTLDFKCLIYNKSGNDINHLEGLGLNNGATLRLFAEMVDEKIKQLNFLNTSLPYIRSNNLVNSLQQFATSVDHELEALSDSIATIVDLSNVSVSAVDTNSIDMSASGTLNHTISSSLKVSPQSNNLLSVLSDGVYVSPQTISVNYSAKTISISNGNTIDLSGIVCTPSGYLGNIASDPSSSVDGNIWYNTTQNKLKIKANGVIKEIPTI